ncbi:MAG: hypothetical protein LC725_00550 [Lentisphaerae bacterium]|nr:hypothetical protein [Lentisphaerota bacterium]
MIHLLHNKGEVEMPGRDCLGVELTNPPALTAVRRTIAGRLRARPVPDDGLLPVAGCLPVSSCLTVWLDAPFDSWSKTCRVLPSLLDARLPFALEDCVYRFVARHRTPGAAGRVLAVAVRRVNLEEHLAAWRAAGYDPVTMDHKGLALWTAALEEWPLPDDAVRAILYVNAGELTLVVGRGACFGAAHALAFTAPLGDDAINLLASRLARVLHAELTEATPLHWLVCAGTDGDDRLARDLPGRLAENWPGPVRRPADESRFLARALAARALSPGDWRCNLRVGALAHPLAQKWRQHLARRAYAVLLTAGLLLIAVNFWWQSALRSRTADVQSAVAALAAELAPEARIPYGREVEEARQSLEQLNREVAPVLNALHSGFYARIGLVFEAIAGLGVTCQQFQADNDGFNMRCAASDWELAESLAARLRALGYGVQVNALPGLDDGRAAFTLEGRWGGAP